MVGARNVNDKPASPGARPDRAGQIGRASTCSIFPEDRPESWRSRPSLTRTASRPCWGARRRSWTRSSSTRADEMGPVSTFRPINDRQLGDQSRGIGITEDSTMNRIVTVGRGPVAAAVLAVLLGACGGPGSQPTSSPEPTATPEAPAEPTSSPIAAPPLTQSFTSTLHGYFSVVPRGMGRSSGDRALDG